jgi:hypothetical protein
MKTHFWITAAIVTALFVLIRPAYPREDKNKDGGQSGAFSYSKDAQDRVPRSGWAAFATADARRR